MDEIDNIIAQLERQRAAIDSALEALRGVAGQAVATNYTPATKKTRGRPKGRRMSAEARKRMSEAQRARWAAQKSGATKKRATNRG